MAQAAIVAAPKPTPATKEENKAQQWWQETNNRTNSSMSLFNRKMPYRNVNFNIDSMWFYQTQWLIPWWYISTYLLHRSQKQNTKITSPNIYTSDALEPLIETKKTSLMQFVFSVGGICITMCILRHLETCRPLLVLKQSCTVAEGLQPVSKKDLCGTARHKHRVKTSQSYARVNIYLAVCLENPINCWPPAVMKRWVEAACVAAPMPVPATKVWNCNRLYKRWCMEKTHQINKNGRF